MAIRVSGRAPVSMSTLGRRIKTLLTFAGCYVTADLRSLPDFIIIGTQRGGTTSLYRWLTAHPDVAPGLRKEVHYFDGHYARGMRWYRAHFPFRRRGRITGESSPYLLFHPLAPERAARRLPESTRFIVLLREPTQRAISHYWLWQQRNLWETEPLERAMELEPERLAAQSDRFRRGERSIEHIAFSYMARGEYAEQLSRWFDAVGRDRILVLESEQLFSDPATAEGVLTWLGLAPHDYPFPVTNGAPRLDEASPQVIARLDQHFAPLNRDLFDLLGYELWSGTPAYGRSPE